MRKTIVSTAVLVMLAAAGSLAYAVTSETHARLRPDEAPPMPTTAYAPQKVVYHVNQGNGWLSHDHLYRLSVMQNHVNALEPGKLDLRVVIQGTGLSILSDAKKDPAIAARIDRLRSHGVRFLICRNTMIGRDIRMSDLYGAKPEDIVIAGVAEVASLSQQGFVMLKP
ncbi:MAG: DsrE family protein [Alsobacter sp.]